MPITNEQINLLLSQQEEILLTLSEIKSRLDSGDKLTKKNTDMLEKLNGGSQSFSAGVRG